MRNLDVFDIAHLEITAASCGYKLSPVVFPVFCRVLLIYQLLQRFHHGAVGRVVEERNRKPFPSRIHHHPVLHTLILFIAPNLYKHKYTRLIFFLIPGLNELDCPMPSEMFKSS